MNASSEGGVHNTWQRNLAYRATSLALSCQTATVGYTYNRGHKYWPMSPCISALGHAITYDTQVTNMQIQSKIKIFAANDTFNKLGNPSG